MSNLQQPIPTDSTPTNGPGSLTKTIRLGGTSHSETIENESVWAQKADIEARAPALAPEPGIDTVFPRTLPQGRQRVVDLNRGPNNKIVIGLGVTGGVIAVFTVVIAVVIMKRRRKAKKLREMEEILEREEELRKRERRLRRRIAAGEDVEMGELGTDSVPEMPESSKKQSSGYKKVTSEKDLKRFRGNHYFV